MNAADGARRFWAALAALLAATTLHRVVYVVQQAGADPYLSHPAYDAAYYLDWGRALVDGRGFVDGAFYLAPLEAWLAAAVLLAGGGVVALLALQQALGVATAGLIAIVARRAAGDAAGLVAAALFALHHPLTFFASRPMPETASILLAVAAVAVGWARDPSTPARAGGAGVLIGLASLGRPNLLLVGAAWLVLEAVRRRPARVAALALGLAVTVAPVSVRNLAASGHLVPISSNGGLTAFHGNGPGALGVFTPPASLSGAVGSQREEATAVASRLSGRQLDPVEADAWWGRRALRTRVGDPGGTARLLAWRVLLTIDSAELGLDFHPLTDPVPARATLRLGSAEVPLVPFGLLLGLAIAGLLVGGARASGGWPVWCAAIACAATPILFYVSSRYRLPTAALLCVPAGAGLVGLVRRGTDAPRRAIAGTLAAGVVALSLAVPSDALSARTRAASLGGIARARLASGDVDGAARDVDRALALDPSSAIVRLQEGLVDAARGDVQAAIDAYREALRIDPGLAAAAVNLSALLLPRRGHAEAIAALRRALVARPFDEACWYNLVVHLIARGDRTGARLAAAEAASRGIRLDPELLALVDPDPSAGGGAP